MKALLVAVIAALVGSVLFSRVGLAFGNTVGAIVAKGALFLLLVGYTASGPRGFAPATIVAASVGSTVLLGMCAMIGALVFDKSPALGNMMMASVSIGYYPAGAYVPLLPGFGVWGASSIAVILVGFVAGNMIRTILRKVEPQDPGASYGRED